MLSAIGVATHLQVAGARLAAPIARKAISAPTAFFRRTNIHGNFVVRRGFSVTRPGAAQATAEGTVRNTKKSTVKKPATKKSKPKKPAAKKKPVKKALSETAKKRLVMSSVAELKRLAFYGEAPRPGALTAWQVFITKNASVSSANGGLAKHTAQLAQQFHNMSVAERAQLSLEADKNKAAYQSNYRAWVETKKAEDIWVANCARQALKRHVDDFVLKSSKLLPIVDERLPRRPVTSLGQFMKARHQSGDLANLTVGDAGRRIGADWAGLAEAERKPFSDAAAADLVEYREKMKSLLGSNWEQTRDAKRRVVYDLERKIKRPTQDAHASPSP